MTRPPPVLRETLRPKPAAGGAPRAFPRNSGDTQPRLVTCFRATPRRRATEMLQQEKAPTRLPGIDSSEWKPGRVQPITGLSENLRGASAYTGSLRVFLVRNPISKNLVLFYG